jgi:hypothetical protein
MIHAFAPTFRSRKPISVRADNHGCVLVAVVWLVMSTTGATFAQNQPPPPLFATPKNLKTTDCFEKYLWDKWFKFFSEGRVGRDPTIIDIPDSPIAAGVPGAAPIWSTYTRTHDGTDVWELKDGTIVERGRDGSVREKRGGTVKQICPPRVTAAPPPQPPTESPPPGASPPPKSSECFTKEDQAELDRLYREYGDLSKELNQLEDDLYLLGKRITDYEMRISRLQTYIDSPNDPDFPRAPGDETINPAVEKADVEAKLRQAELDDARLRERRERLWKERDRLNDQIYNQWGKKKSCPNKTIGMRTPGAWSGPRTYETVATVATDSTRQCTFADGSGVRSPVALADEDGNPIPSDSIPVAALPPPTAETPPSGRTPDTPPRTSTVETPPRTTDTPPRTPTTETPPSTAETPPPGRTPDMPPQTPTTETPPRTPTTDTPPPRTPETPPTQTTDVPPKTPTSDDIPSTVFVKANEEVVRGEPTGQPLASQMVKLLAERPALPSTRESKTAQDTGFDKPPAQCTTGADGRCKFEVPADERPVYGLPVTDTAARRPNYRVEFNALKSSGGVAEITGRKPGGTERAPTDGGNIASEIFNIGNRIFQRFGFNTPYESREDVEASYRSAFGDKYQVDTCETKKLPALPLDIEPSSFNEPSHELSQATIKLDRAARSGRTSR